MRSLNPMQIRITRRKRGLTQQMLAKRVGCARNSISRAELGACGAGMARRIADALGVDVEEFYSPTDIDDQLTQEEKELIMMIRKLGPEGVKAVRYMVMGIAAGKQFQGSREPAP